MRFSTFFKLDKKQAELDFVDVDTSQDMRLFIDPYAIEMRDDELSLDLAHHVTTFFEDVLGSLRKKDHVRAKLLTSNLGEPQETFLEMSKGKPQGRGMRRFDADQLLRALEASNTRSRNFRRDEVRVSREGCEPALLVDELVPGAADCLEHSPIVVQHTVREIPLAQVQPDTLHRVQLGRR